jgi:MoaA/NifB/PqqE/SkfB family radical SAM enzyme
MGFEEVTEAIRTFYRQGGRCLYLEGGEPFLWCDGNYGIEDVVECAHRMGYFTVIIYTNGTFPLQTSADTVFISIDGLQETHDHLRGPSFDRIMENIHRSTHSSLFVNFTINNCNKDEVEDLLRQLLEYRKKYRILNSRAGLRSALRNDWKRPLDICSVYEKGNTYTCCRYSDNPELCRQCGYLSYAEIDQTLGLKPSAILNALKYF